MTDVSAARAFKPARETFGRVCPFLCWLYWL